MAQKKEEKEKENGFAGLSSLVSDVDVTPPPAAKTESVAAGPSTGHPNSQSAQPQPSQTYQESAQPQSSGSSGGKWVLGVAVVIAVLWLIGQSDKSTTSPTTTDATPSYATPAEPQAPSRPQESVPPVGQNLVFSTAQIRYCLAEDIRLEGAKSTIDSAVDADVERFNAVVADYNSRCGRFRYHSGALESARSDIEPYRSQLQSEGGSKFTRPSDGAPSTPAPVQAAPNATVQEVQRRLNELGYEVGAADGLMGQGTRSAIIAFQEKMGLAQTGVADAELLLQIDGASARSIATPTAPPTYSPTLPLAATPTPQTQLSKSSGEADLSIASPSEQEAIENACGYHKRVNGPADYYRCQQKELSKLSSSGGQPDLSRTSASERAAIESACGYNKRVNGPADYYRCQRTELSKLSNSGGQPDLSRVSALEKESIESACGYHKRVNGPADYYRCQQTELSKLSNSGSQPDLSRVSALERTSIENACGYHKRVNGPADYYQCLRSEMNKLR